MPNYPKENLLSVLRQYYEPVRLHGQSFYALNSQAILYFRYSKLHPRNTYFFGVEADDLARFTNQNTFILFICGAEDNVIVLPISVFLEMVAGVKPNSTQWKILATQVKGRWFLRIPGKGQTEVSSFRNYYDFTPKELQQSQTPSLGEHIPLLKNRRQALVQEELALQNPEELPDVLLEVSQDSAHFVRFERAVEHAMNELGLEAKLLGGPGSTDILVRQPFRAIVECKSTSSGSISQVNFTRIKRHATQENTKIAVVTGIRFDRAVIEDAASEGVALLDVPLLIQLLKSNKAFPIAPQSFRSLFETPGLIETTALAPLEDKWQEAERKIATLTALLQALDSGHRTVTELKGRLEGSGLGQFTVEEIETALAFLAAPVLNVVETSKEGYALSLPVALATLRLKTIFNRLQILSP